MKVGTRLGDHSKPLRAAVRDVSKAVRLLTQHGVREGLRRGTQRYFLRLLAGEDQRYDERLAISTQSYIETSDLTTPELHRADALPYIASPVRLVRALLDGLGIDFPGWTFVDFGSGKGRVLMVACEYHFDRLIGVEFAQELHEEAVTNTGSLRSAPRIELVHADAVDFEIPASDCILYFNNPFGPAVLRYVLDNIDRASERATRRLIIVYQTRLERTEHLNENLELLRRTTSLVERRVRPPRLLDRILLSGYVTAAFEHRAA